MRTLYPAIKPFTSQFIEVDDLHQIYVEECGTADGIPVLFVHGGPGAGCTEHDRCFFDPEKYRIILFDQRGCGRSKPHASLEKNDTDHLIEDIESIRTHLKVDQWLLFGCAWGSTLTLLYAQTYSEHVLGLIVSGVFLSRPQDIDWLFKSGANRTFPDHWTHFLEIIPENERTDLLEAYYQRLVGSDELARMNAAKHWSLWEGNTGTLRPNLDHIHAFSDPHLALSLARIECHYFKHQSFIQPNQIIEHMNQISTIPGIIVHGRYDMISPLDSAQMLANHWTEADLHIIRDAGHATCEPGIIDALIRATDEFPQKLKQ